MFAVIIAHDNWGSWRRKASTVACGCSLTSRGAKNSSLCFHLVSLCRPSPVFKCGGGAGTEAAILLLQTPNTRPRPKQSSKEKAAHWYAVTKWMQTACVGMFICVCSPGCENVLAGVWLWSVVPLSVSSSRSPYHSVEKEQLVLCSSRPKQSVFPWQLQGRGQFSAGYGKAAMTPILVEAAWT